MILIGVNRSPYTRRVAIVLEQYGMAYEKRDLTGFANWDEVKGWSTGRGSTTAQCA